MGRICYETLPRYPITWNGESAEIGTVDELLVALDVLNRQHDRAILSQLAPMLGSIISAGDRPAHANLKLLLKPLSGADRLYVIAEIGARIALLIGNATELRNLLVSLTDLDVEAAVLRTIGESGLKTLIVRSQQLWEILEWLFGESDLTLLELLGPEYLRRLIVHAHDLAEILCRIDPERQIRTLEMLGWDRVLGLLQNDVDLREVSSALCTAAFAALIERLSATRIVELAGSAVGWYEFGRCLSAPKTTLLCQKFEGKQHAS